jgi:hypothetical protein
VLTPEQERQPVLKFVQEAVEKAAPSQELKAGRCSVLAIYGYSEMCICYDVKSIAIVFATLLLYPLLSFLHPLHLILHPLSSGMPQLMVQDGEKLGRRKAMAGKESGPTVTAVESSSVSNAVSERDAMALLTRFQFPSKRW